MYKSVGSMPRAEWVVSEHQLREQTVERVILSWGLGPVNRHYSEQPTHLGRASVLP